MLRGITYVFVWEHKRIEIKIKEMLTFIQTHIRLHLDLMQSSVRLWKL